MGEQGERTKVAILGGGVGSIVAAFELTRTEELRDRFEVTVYQLGWRLGGKGASGRDRDNGDRILEHGLHVWFGFYDEAWKAMRAAYEELDRPRHSPLHSLETAFTPCDQVVLYDRQGDDWVALPRNFPRTRQRPGDPHALPTLQAIAVAVMRWNREVFEPVRKALTLWPARNALAATRAPVVDPDLKARAQHIVAGDGEQPPDDIALLLRAAETLAEPASDGAMQGLLGDPFPLGLFVRMLGAARDATWRLGEDGIRGDAQIRVLFTMFDTAVSALTGIVEDDVLVDGFDAVNDWELCDWLAHHGAKEVTVGATPEERAPILRSVYDVAFGYPQGDIARANVAAGTALTDLIRLSFGYRGSVFYKM